MIISDFENYIISNNPAAFQKIHNKENLPWTLYVGVLGMAGASLFVLRYRILLIILRPSGKTASFAWQEYSAAKKVHLNPPGICTVLIPNVIQGDVVFVTTGAGKAYSLPFSFSFHLTFHLR
jgi:hypothetical protein